MALHLLVPGAVARWGYAKRWWRAWAMMLATMVIDLDHLMAVPIFDPQRCSIGFHPLHTWPSIMVYLVLTGLPRTRLVGLGLMIHMIVDGIDCWWMGFQLAR